MIKANTAQLAQAVYIKYLLATPPKMVQEPSGGYVENHGNRSITCLPQTHNSLSQWLLTSTQFSQTTCTCPKHRNALLFQCFENLLVLVGKFFSRFDVNLVRHHEQRLKTTGSSHVTRRQPINRLERLYIFAGELESSRQLRQPWLYPLLQAKDNTSFYDATKYVRQSQFS